MPTADSHSAGRQWPEAGVGTGRTAPPLPLPTNGARPTAERRLGGLGQGRRRGGGRLARPGAAAGPHDRADARRVHATAATDAARVAPAEAAGGDADRTDQDDVDAAGADAVDAAARTAVLVAVPP